MSEEKVWVEKMPESCNDCSFAYDGKCQALESKEYYCIENCRRGDCPLIDIKTHDRELVKEVCDDLALSLVEFSEDFTMSRDEILEWLQKYKDQIQKEFEK